MYHIDRCIRMVGDTRAEPRYPTSTVCTSALVMTSCQMGSLNEWEQSRLLPAWQKYLGLGELPKADTMGDVATKLKCDDIRTVVKMVYRTLKRNKALKSGFHDNLFFLVIDGHECCSSYLRCCDDCLQREITTAAGVKTQYYHRYAMGMLISASGVSIPLDIEMQKPGEDEVACALRLVQRLCRMYPRAFDVVMADGLYARAPFFKAVTTLGKEVIAVLKDERRDLIKEARSRSDGVKPYTFQRSNGVSVDAWDLPDCQEWTQLAMPVRVVRTVETTIVCRQQTGQVEQKTSEWLWVTTISRQHLSTQLFVEAAHHRWDIENKGFNELATFWHLNHMYKHDANAIVAFTLITMLSYTLFHAFLYLNVKTIFRELHTKRYLQRKIMAGFYNEDNADDLDADP